MARQDRQRATQPGHPGRGPTRLAAFVPRVARSAFKRHGFAEVDILTRWPAIVGAHLAAHSLPERLRFTRDKSADAGGVLTVRVEGGMGVELQHLEPLVVDRINTYCGYRAVQALRIVQGPVLRPHPSSPARARQMSASEREALAATLDGTLAGIGKGPLRQALGRLGRHVLGSGKPERGRDRPVAIEEDSHA